MVNVLGIFFLISYVKIPSMFKKLIVDVVINK